jgi:hypothetical protein
VVLGSAGSERAAAAGEAAAFFRGARARVGFRAGLVPATVVSLSAGSVAGSVVGAGAGAGAGASI